MPNDDQHPVRVTPGGAVDIDTILTDAQLQALQNRMIAGTIVCGRCKREHPVQYTLLGGDIAIDCPCGAKIRLAIVGEVKPVKEPGQE
jgi:hypothetical protein